MLETFVSGKSRGEHMCLADIGKFTFTMLDNACYS